MVRIGKRPAIRSVKVYVADMLGSKTVSSKSFRLYATFEEVKFVVEKALYDEFEEK